MWFRSLAVMGSLAEIRVGGEWQRRDRRAEPSPTHTAPAFNTEATAAKVPQSPATLKQQPDAWQEDVSPQHQPHEMTLVSMPVTKDPPSAGQAKAPFWAPAPAITTLEYASQRPITLTSASTTAEVFFLGTYPDTTPSETPKPWRWDAKEAVTRGGSDREDVLIFPWRMRRNDVSLALRNGDLHHADLWFWQACRPHPAGYADDTRHRRSLDPGSDARQLPSPPDSTLACGRGGDKGEVACAEHCFFVSQGDQLTPYAPQYPTGSLADGHATSAWDRGQWTIAFARQFTTGYKDDGAFIPGEVSFVGVACDAMVYDMPPTSWSQSLYRTSVVCARLFFSMSPRDGT